MKELQCPGNSQWHWNFKSLQPCPLSISVLMTSFDNELVWIPSWKAPPPAAQCDCNNVWQKISSLTLNLCCQKSSWWTNPVLTSIFTFFYWCVLIFLFSVLIQHLMYGLFGFFCCWVFFVCLWVLFVWGFLCVHGCVGVYYYIHLFDHLSLHMSSLTAISSVSLSSHLNRQVELFDIYGCLTSPTPIILPSCYN